MNHGSAGARLRGRDSGTRTLANHNRRVYEPSDEVRVFDGAGDEEDVEGSRPPLLVVLAPLVPAPLPFLVLPPAAGREKIAPQQPGGTNVPYQGFKFYEQPAPQDDAGDTDAAPAAAA